MARKKKRKERILDLHGLTHSEAESAILEFIAFNEAPFKVITGNSSKMKEISVNILDKNEFQYKYEHWFNLGCLVVME